jgi:predicted lysophospholipase L1 biosynthesis ABC-type transport system permease subunit
MSAETATQDFRTHRRWDPWYHFFASPVLVVAFFVHLWRAIKTPSAWTIWETIVAAALVVLLLKVRTYALRDQDRIIRLEERLRLSALLSEPLKSRSAALTVGQLTGLRFASDAEVAALVQAALDENLSGEAIKKRITVWRPDFFRV